MKVTKCLYCGDDHLSYVTKRSDNNTILNCEKCGLMMVQDINDDTQKLYTSDYFQKDKASKNGYTDYLSSPVANLIGKYGFSRLFAKNVGKHLDLGSADGSLMEIFVSEGFESKGLEISKDAVEIAQTKGLNVSFSKLDKFPTEIPKSDVITAFDLLEHVDKPGVVLKEIYKNLEDNGYFVFSTLSVKHRDSSDYWFNNSLEHYVYFDHDSLSNVLKEVFGLDSFAFVEMEIHGIAEFWGIAKKGKIKDEKKIISTIESSGFNENRPEEAYLLSLFYNQLSKFSESKKIINYFQSSWPVDTSLEAKFYNCYFQGKFEEATQDSKDNKHLMAAANSIYWQALCDAEERLFEIKKEDLLKESNNEIMELRNQTFVLRDELHSLRNSRVLGKIIKLRDYIGTSRHKILQLPKRVLHKARVIIAPYVPANSRRAIKRIYHKAKARNIKHLPKDIKLITNQPWDTTKPLVSVVIPYYNRASTIDDTVDSLANQTFIDFEVLIVDDGSTETESIEKLNKIKQDKPDIKIIHQTNSGVAAARNKGVSEAAGKYIICLDSDDILSPLFIEKCTAVLESDSDVSLVTTYRKDFGVINDTFRPAQYDPMKLYTDNMVITAAEFRKEAWDKAGGYTSGIGYEDWEFWLKLGEKGFWGKQIPEELFIYRTSMQSRYIEDKDIHWRNLKNVRALHPNYKKNIKKLLLDRQATKHQVTSDTALINMNDPANYAHTSNNLDNILITIPWMTFGGAETLIYNYCREIKDSFNLTFVTGLKSEHEWEYKFKEITPNVYHLANLFEDQKLYIEFISNYINTRKIDILHIIHNGFTFEMLPELRKRHPKLKVIVTMFNDRVEYFEQSIGFETYIDEFVSDNKVVQDHYTSRLKGDSGTRVIPNGINCYQEFNKELFDVSKERSELGIDDKDLSVFFVGRLSVEKNPNIFIEAANKVLEDSKFKNLKFFIIGDGPMKPEIEDMLQESHNPKIVYLGYQTAIAKYLSAADMFVLPSSIEGFPLSILEAMAMQVAVIASDVGAVSQVVESGKTGYVVEPGSVSEIAKNIKKLASDSNLLEAIKIASRKAVEKKYSNIVLGENYKKLYRDVNK